MKENLIEQMASQGVILVGEAANRYIDLLWAKFIVEWAVGGVFVFCFFYGVYRLILFAIEDGRE